MKKFKVYGWNHRFFASGYLKEVCDTREQAEKLAKDNNWIMDEYEIHEIEVA